MCTLSACDSKEEKKDDAAKPSAKEADAEAPKKDEAKAPEAKAPEPKDDGKPQMGSTIELEEVTDDKLGYSIQLPKGSKVLQKDDESGIHTYTLVFSGDMHELNTHITKTAHADLAAFEKHVGEFSTKGVATAEEVEGDKLQVVTKELDVFGIEVWVTLKGKELDVRCSGPAKHKEDLMKVCMSLASTK